MACSGRQQDQVLAQKQLATSSNQTATFFGLHAEVRNAIYKELFRDTELRETNRYRATWSHGFVPSSLLTCRRFYQEALAVLAACITLVFNGPTFGSDHIPIIFLRRIRRLDILVPRPSKRFLQEQLSRLPDLRVLLLAGLTVWLDGTQEDLVTLPFRLSHLGEKVIMSAMVAYMAYFDARLRERVKRKNSDLKVFLRVQLELLPTKRSQNQIVCIPRNCH